MAFISKLQQIGKRHREIIIGAFLGCVFVFLIVAGYVLHWTGTGFSNKSLWDWMQLLIVPALIAFGVAWLTTRQNHDREIAREQHEHDIKIAVDNQREAALQGYIDHMSELLLEKKLRESGEEDEVRNIATARTVTVLPHLDSQRKRSVIKFLHDAGLIKRNEAVINLMEADLSGANLSGADLGKFTLVASELTFVDLSGADLSRTILSQSSMISSILYEANLQGADLSEGLLFMTNFVRADLRNASLVKADLTGAWLMNADLRGADLSDAHMVKADLRGADLSSAKVNGAKLDEADLTGAKVTQEQLDAVISLKDAIMPDGSIHS